MKQINDVLYPAGVSWNVSITNQSGDTTRFTRQAIEDGADVVGSLMSVGVEIVGRGSQFEGFQLWRAREIKFECDPPQTVQGDGEIWDNSSYSESSIKGAASPGTVCVTKMGRECF